MAFSSSNAMSFFDAISSGAGFWGEFFSHLGWIGVPVFVFLTGYGVSHSEFTENSEIIEYIRRNYLKLFALLLPAVFFFGGIDFLKGNIWPDLFKRISYLTMMVNFAYPVLNCNPGVYWYFGLTFQFYLLWAFLGKRMNGKKMLMWSVILLLVLFCLSAYEFPVSLSIFRHCFTGWFPVFAIGVWMGKRKYNWFYSNYISIWKELLLFMALFGLILLMSRWMVTWVFIPIIALAWFIVMEMLLMRTRYLSDVFRWIGEFSACVFVCHPIARYLELKFFAPHFSMLIVNVGIYAALTVVIVLMYNMYYQWVLGRLLNKRIK